MNGSDHQQLDWLDAATPAGRREHAALIRMYEAFDQDHDRLCAELLAALPVETPRRATQATSAWPKIGEFVMNRVFTRRGIALLAPAACVALAAAAFFMREDNLAFADVAERLNAVESVVCRVRTSVMGSTPSQSEGTLYFSAKHGVRYDLNAKDASGFTFYRPSEGPAVIVNPEMKTRITMTHADTPDPALAHKTPDEWIHRLLRMADEPDRRLGRQKIDGRLAEGFELSAATLGQQDSRLESTSFASSAQVWVDVETEMPIRFVVHGSISELDAELSIVHDQFRWGEPVDAAMFQPPATDGEFDVSVSIPPSTEEALVAGLRLYADTVGEYPSVLEAATMTGRVMGTLVVKSDVARSPQDPEFKRIAQEVLVILAGCKFYGSLEREGRQPQYFGVDVKPGDATAILLRWSLEDGRTRILYGDLRTETRN